MTRRILLVDDEDDIREVAATSLELLGGYEVRTAASGHEALEILRGETPDAIVLDVMMPGMDGPTLLQALRDDATTAAIPVVFLTAKVQARDVEQFNHLGVAGFITKPFDPTTIPAELASVLGW